MAINTGIRTTTIANGASLSAAVELDGMLPVGIIMPAAWTAASITIQLSHDKGVTYSNVYKSGTEWSITGTAAIWELLPNDPYFFGATHMKIRSGTAGSAVNQAAERAFKVVLAAL